MQHKTANVEEGARLDIRASGFWGSRHESAFLTFGCLTHTRSVTTDPPQQQCTEGMKWRSEEVMNNEYVR